MIRSWNDHVGFTFCEGAWASPRPFLGADELVNCLSSCVLLGVGIRGGVRRGIDDFTCLLYGALTVCGVGSFMFHAHLIEAFRFVDELAILYLASLGYYVAALNYIRQKDIRSPGVRYGFAVVSVLSFIGIAEMEIFNGSLYLFFLLTAALVIAIFGFFFNGRDWNKFEQELAVKGEAACGVATISWLVDMGFCWKLVSYFYLHAVWHCLAAIAINCCLEIYESQINRARKRGFRTIYCGPFVFVSPLVSPAVVL